MHSDKCPGKSSLKSSSSCICLTWRLSSPSLPKEPGLVARWDGAEEHPSIADSPPGSCGNGFVERLACLCQTFAQALVESCHVPRSACDASGLAKRYFQGPVFHHSPRHLLLRRIDPLQIEAQRVVLLLSQPLVPAPEVFASKIFPVLGHRTQPLYLWQGQARLCVCLPQSFVPDLLQLAGFSEDLLEQIAGPLHT